MRLLPAIPYRADRRLRPAGPEAAAVPAPAVEARPSGPVIMRAVEPVVVLPALACDHLGRAVAGQEAVAVPAAGDGPLLVDDGLMGRGGRLLRRRGERCRRQHHGDGEDA